MSSSGERRKSRGKGATWLGLYRRAAVAYKEGGAGRAGEIGRLPCGRDGGGGLPFERAPSAGERKERGARKKEREGDGSADMRGQGRSEREKEQRAWAKRVRAVQRRRAVKGRSGAGRADGAPAGPRGRVVRSRPAWDGPRGRKKGRGGRRPGRFLGWAKQGRKEVFQVKSLFYF